MRLTPVPGWTDRTQGNVGSGNLSRQPPRRCAGADRPPWQGGVFESSIAEGKRKLTVACKRSGTLERHSLFVDLSILLF